LLEVLLHPFRDILGNGSLFDNAMISLGRVILGFLVAAALAIPLGIGMGRSETIFELFDPVMQLLRPIPPLAWVPLALAWSRSSCLYGFYYRAGCILPDPSQHA